MESVNRLPQGVPFAGVLPFPASQRRYHLARCKPGQPVKGCCINPQIQGVVVHWIEGRTLPCSTDDRTCPFCREGSRARWYGYMPALLRDLGRIALVEITYEAAKCCDFLRNPLPSLRGKEIKVERAGNSKRSRCIVTFEDILLNSVLPPVVDVGTALKFIWEETPCIRPMFD